MAAIDQAVADGVDVINYSISGTLDELPRPGRDLVPVRGRRGRLRRRVGRQQRPDHVSTVAHPGPWITTVAAGTHNRDGAGSVTLGNGVTYYGASLADGGRPGAAHRLDGGRPARRRPDAGRAVLRGGRQRRHAVLDPAKVAGKIVVCDRGVTARVNKSLAVQEAGGVGHDPGQHHAPTRSTPTSTSSRPSTCRTPTARPSRPTRRRPARRRRSTRPRSSTTPRRRSRRRFSSRGPLLAGGGDLLKPDVIAPGQDILAAVCAAGNGGLDFNLYSGTSMSSPHVAGLAALLKDLHPDWSPMMIKSALMTTRLRRPRRPEHEPARDLPPGRRPRASPTARPIPAWCTTPAGTTGWPSCAARRPASARRPAPLCAGVGYSIDPSDFNVASIAIGDLAGVQTVTRKVTNVGAATATYTASFTGMAGISVSRQPGFAHPRTRAQTQSLHGHVHPRRRRPSTPTSAASSPGPTARTTSASRWSSARSPSRPRRRSPATAARSATT